MALGSSLFGGFASKYCLLKIDLNDLSPILSQILPPIMPPILLLFFAYMASLGEVPSPTSFPSITANSSPDPFSNNSSLRDCFIFINCKKSGSQSSIFSGRELAGFLPGFEMFLRSVCELLPLYCGILTLLDFGRPESTEKPFLWLDFVIFIRFRRWFYSWSHWRPISGNWRSIGRRFFLIVRGVIIRVFVSSELFECFEVSNCKIFCCSI